MRLPEVVRTVRRRVLAGSRAAREARRRSGKSYLSQTSEILRLRWGPGRLGVREYYAKRVYDETLYPGSAKREVAGRKRVGDLWRSLNDARWVALARDKLVFYAFARGLGLPTPPVVAVFHENARACGDVPCLRTAVEMADFLRRCDRYPLFGKQVDGAFGSAATSIDGLDVRSDRLRLASGETPTVREFVDAHVVAHPKGYLFQERVQPHPDLLDLCGPHLTVLRLNVMNLEDGPRLFRAGWKVPVGDNIEDHFRSGRSRNLAARLDRQSGEVLRVVRGTGERQRPGQPPNVPGEDVEIHPDTGERLLGHQLPDYERAVTITLSAHSALPGLRWLGWDVALGRDGPVLLECNHLPFMPQMVGEGFLDAELQDWLRPGVDGDR